MEILLTFITQHWGTISVAAGWIIHTWLPELKATVKSIYPFVSTHGGIWGVTKTFFVGKKPEKIKKIRSMGQTKQIEDIVKSPIVISTAMPDSGSIVINQTK